MTPRKLAVIAAALLAAMGGIGALADVPTGATGEDARSSLFLLAMVVLLVAVVLLFGPAGWTVPNVTPKGEPRTGDWRHGGTTPTSLRFPMNPISEGNHS